MDNKTLRYDYWHEFSYEKIKEDILKFKPSKLAIMGENEWCPWIEENIIELVNKFNIHVVFVTGSPKNNTTEKLVKDLGINSVEVQYWPVYFMYFSYISKYKSPKIFFKYPFICLNNRPHLHRCLVIDEMAKLNLLDKGVTTWIDLHNELSQNNIYKFKYFDGNKRALNDNFSEAADSHSLPEEFNQSLFHFVNESSYEIPMFSEKVSKPILNFKPFLTLGCKDFNKFLQDFGFLLYDEIFDYSYDSVEDVELRSKMFVENIKKVSTITDFYQYYKILKPKIIYNYTIFLKIIKDHSLIPKEVNEIISTIPKDKTLISDHFHIKYREYIKRTSN